MTCANNAVENQAPDLIARSKLTHHHLRCLVVDDNPFILQYVADLLGELGFQEVDTAQKKTELMNNLTTGPYDLLVTDLEMPDMNGFDLSRMIKKEVHDTKVIIMTGRHKDECLALMDARWVNGWLFKPFGFNELHYELVGLGLSEQIESIHVV